MTNVDIAYLRAVQRSNTSDSLHETLIKRTQAELEEHFNNPLDAEDVEIDGVAKKLLIINGYDEDIKKIYSRPTETFNLGSYILWMDTWWICLECDCDDRINTHGTMNRCHGHLRWIDSKGVLQDYPAYIEDATKYSEGAKHNTTMGIPDFQIKARVKLDANTAVICRDMRFIIDADYIVNDILAAGDRPIVYKVTRRNPITGTRDHDGYEEITMVEDQWREGKDDAILLIANETMASNQIENEDSQPREEGGWL